MVDFQCPTQPPSKKCREELEKVFGKNWTNTFIVQKRFYQVQNPALVKEWIAEGNEWLYCQETGDDFHYGFYCPACGERNWSAKKLENQILTPLSCCHCEKVGWIFDDVLYGLAYQDDYDLLEVTEENAQDMAETYGIPKILLVDWGVDI